MARSLSIDIWGLDWYIETGIKVENEAPYDFPMIGNYNVVDGKIVHLHDYMLTDKLFKACKDFGGVLLEKCSFLYIPRDKEGELNPNDEQSFEGTFLDALVFIKKELEKEEKRRKYPYM